MSRNIKAILAVSALAFATAAAAQTAKPVDAALVGDVVTVTARIEAVDQATRMVTLKGPEGRVVTMKASDAVKNLAQVKAGDELVIKHAEAVAIALKRGSAGRSSVTTTLPPQTAPLGARPAMVTAQETVLVANVTSVDAAKKSVVLQGPQGRYLPLKVKDAALLKDVKVGDSVEVTFIEALLMEVVGPKK
jgi:Cu/Ag efflux protein CusF